MLGFLLHEGTKDTKVFLGSIARVYLTTEYTEHTERHSSAVSREGAKTRRLEGECPHEPPSAARKDGRDERRSSAGKQTLVRYLASLTTGLAVTSGIPHDAAF